MSTESIKDKIITARVGLLLRHPFFGNMATRLKIIEASNWCKTAATDGINLYYNTEFFEKLEDREIEFVFAHEILHNVFNHMLRREGRDAMLFNIACDYCVNGQLVRDKIGTEPKDIPIYHDPKHYEKSAEQIYDELYENADKIDLPSLGKLLDEHIDWEQSSDDGRPSYSKEQLQNIKDKIIDDMMQSAQAAGTVPSSVSRLIKDLTESKMNWREILRNQIQSTIKNDYTWIRPSRKGWHTSAILPGMNYQETIDIAIALDNSGSCYHEVVEFLSEIKGIMEEYKDFKIKLWTFDTQTYNEQDFTSDNSEDLTQYEIQGGGGTDFHCNWDHMIENDYVPKKLLILTDGYNNSPNWCPPGMEEYCDTIFILHGTNTMESPFGTTVYMN